MYQFLANIWDSFVSFFTSLWDSFVELVQTVCLWFVELWNWIQQETFNLCVNFLYNTISSVGTSLNPSFTCDRTEFLNALASINCFFPIDNLITYTLFLLATWFTVCVTRILIKLTFAYLSPGGV